MTQGAPSGITWTYRKWVLNGSLFTAVVRFTLAANTTVPTYVTYSQMTIPEWIGKKVYTPINALVKTIHFYGTPDGITFRPTPWRFYLAKDSDTSLSINQDQSYTSGSSAEFFEIRFDLVIDLD